MLFSLPPMKNFAYLLPVLLGFGLSTGAHAQATPQATLHADSSAVVQSAHDYCMIKDGNMMMVRQGHQLTPMTANMTMSDGSMCLTDGTCKRPDGTTLKMKEGQCMLTNGKMMMHPGSVKRPPMKADPKPKEKK